jgi:hypothetical protein
MMTNLFRQGSIVGILKLDDVFGKALAWASILNFLEVFTILTTSSSWLNFSSAFSKQKVSLDMLVTTIISCVSDTQTFE